MASKTHPLLPPPAASPQSSARSHASACATFTSQGILSISLARELKQNFVLCSLGRAPVAAKDPLPDGSLPYAGGRRFGGAEMRLVLHGAAVASGAAAAAAAVGHHHFGRGCLAPASR